MLRCFSCVQLFAILWTVACQAPLSMGFSSQEYCNELPFPFPGNLPYPGIELASLLSLALASRFFTTSATWKAPLNSILLLINNAQIKEVVSTDILKYVENITSKFVRCSKNSAQRNFTALNEC